MPFSSGDVVVHPTHGVGNILRLEEKEVAGNKLQRFYLLTIGPSMIWVPIAADGSTALRAVTSKQELEQGRKVLKSRPTPLEREHKQWRLETNDRLIQGSFKTLCEVVRDLTSLGWHRPMGEVDSSILKKVRDTLRREWAAAAGISLDAATQEIDVLLAIGRKEFRPD
jgi:CarD family transcriptional regulator